MPAALRAVEPGERKPTRERMTALEAATSGTRLDELYALRRIIARALDDHKTAPRDLASLTRRQIEIGKEIASAEAAEVVDRDTSPTDEAFDPDSI